MHTLRRILVGIALLVWLAIPAAGHGGGGENAGGTGVWILPRAVPLCAAASATPVRESKLISDLGQDLMMSVSGECGIAVATFVDDITGVVTALPVSGALVRLPASLLQAMVASSCPQANIVVSDCNHVGYLIELRLAPGSQTISICVY